jgi:anti-sigma factor (TIGR02949 family)
MTGNEIDPGRAEAVDDCANALAHLYEFLDAELPSVDSDEIREHLAACEPCLDVFDAEESLKQLVKRGCSGEQAPEHLRAKVLAAYRVTTRTELREG